MIARRLELAWMSKTLAGCFDIEKAGKAQGDEELERGLHIPLGLRPILTVVRFKRS